MENNDALALIFARNAFYQRLYYFSFATFLLTLFVIGFLSWILVFLVQNPTNPLYFATDGVGRLIQVIPVNRPNMTTDEATNYAVQAVQSAYSYNYYNYRAQLQGAQKYFTSYGWRQYMKALTASNNLVALTQRKQVVIAKVVGKPKLVAQGLLSGAYAWKFQMPVLVTYWTPPYDDNSKFYNALNVSVIVQRQPILQSYQGVGVLQLIATISNQPAQPAELSSTPDVN